jgi:hypothetical protein
MNPEPVRADALADEDGAEPDGPEAPELDHDALRIAEQVANDYHAR